MIRLILAILLFSIVTSFISSDNAINQYEEINLISEKSKYKVGDKVRCSQWENDSYWEGTVVKIVKEVVYQVELKEVRVKVRNKLSFNPSECTGKKRLSYEDGKGFNRTKIWVHERCLD